MGRIGVIGLCSFGTPYSLVFVTKMGEFNYLQFLNDDNELLLAEYLNFGEFPTFIVYFDEWSAQNSSGPEFSITETNKNQTATNPVPTPEVGVSRFPVVSSGEIQELKSVAFNENTCRSI